MWTTANCPCRPLVPSGMRSHSIVQSRQFCWCGCIDNDTSKLKHGLFVQAYIQILVFRAVGYFFCISSLCRGLKRLWQPLGMVPPWWGPWAAREQTRHSAPQSYILAKIIKIFFSPLNSPRPRRTQCSYASARHGDTLRWFTLLFRSAP